jgi:uncharacterized membrane protein
MLEVTFAYVVATALLLSFKTTRWMGAVGVFIALCVAPVLASVVLILVAVACYFLFGKPKWDVIRRRPPWSN